MKKTAFFSCAALAIAMSSVSFGQEPTSEDLRFFSDNLATPTMTETPTGTSQGATVLETETKTYAKEMKKAKETPTPMPVEFNPNFGMVEYLSQQLNLGSGGSKLNVDISTRLPDKDINQGWILGLYGGGGPSPSTQQTAALRLLFPADLGVFATLYHQTSWVDYLITGDLMASTLPEKVLDSKSQLVFTPGFFALSLTAIKDIVSSPDSKDNFQLFSIGARMRLLTTLWDQEQIAPIFATTANDLSWLGSSADYSIWVELAIFNADLKIQYYNFLGGPIGDMAYQGNTNLFNSGAILVSLSKPLDLGGREQNTPMSFK